MHGTRAIPRPPGSVLFDMDGVLVDTFEAWVAVLDECRTRRGMSPLGPGPVRDSWGQGLLADCRTFFPGETPATLAAEYDAGFARHLARVRPEPGAPEAVRAVRAAGIPLALVTNTPRALARRILDQVGVLDAFNVIAGGDEVARGKPDPDLVLLALERIGPRQAAGVLVGDTRLDVDAGRAARIPVVGYRISADARVDDLAELPALLGLGG